ncbi:MAG: arginine--tRNA ligase [candidate division Zixibacteria bacterium]|nr:arginine--tRNA ligase [candidate division Zixibacteria bacterium]
MIPDQFKIDVAELTAEAAETAFGELYEEQPDLFIFDPVAIAERLEKPKNPDMGNYALPLFDLAKTAHGNPADLNKQLTDAQNALINQKDGFDYLSFEAVGGFNNCRVSAGATAKLVLSAIATDEDEYGSSDEGRGKNIVIDFSSPNIAKPFGIGHLRSTAIGNSLYRIFQKLGYRPIGINHLGDWGTQFGKLIVAYNLWGIEMQNKEPIAGLYDLYVKFHREEEKDPSLSEKAREAFKALEDGNQDEAELWKEFRDLSLQSFQQIYDRLGVHFDYNHGESFYNDKMDATVARLEAAGLVTDSQGARVVNLEAYNLPPCLLAKADGATLYATRDIAGILYRWETFRFERALYVVGAAQQDHFKQVFKVIELLEDAEQTLPEERISPRLQHIEFGWIRFKDQAMSTRKGNIIILEDVLNKATTLARELILEKNPDLAELDKTAQIIGVGAVIFADLSTRKHIDVNFDWDAVLTFEGETGPYLQYTHARLCSLLRHYQQPIPETVDYRYLDQPEEKNVLDVLYRFPFVVRESAETCEPYVISTYLLTLGAAFNKVYQRKNDDGKIDRIISDDTEQTAARMALVNAVRVVIREGLYLLGITAPDEM